MAQTQLNTRYILYAHYFWTQELGVNDWYLKTDATHTHTLVSRNPPSWLATPQSSVKGPSLILYPNQNKMVPTGSA